MHQLAATEQRSSAGTSREAVFLQTVLEQRIGRRARSPMATLRNAASAMGVGGEPVQPDYETCTRTPG